MPHKDPQARREYHRNYMRQYVTDPAKREQRNRVANDRATEIRRWLDAYKISVGCVDCGYRQHHAALHFDHVRGEKAFNVCNAKSIAQAQREIEKCEVRCANCHAVRTFKLYPCKPDVFAMTYEAAPSPEVRTGEEGPEPLTEAEREHLRWLRYNSTPDRRDAVAAALAIADHYRNQCAQGKEG